MDWYYGSGISDHLVPEDVWDRLPSPDSWSKWGISAPEGFNLPKRFSIMDTNPREVEFNFDDESFNNEIELESSLHEKDQSSSSSVCGGLLEQSFQQAALSCDQPNYQLQDLSRFEHMDDIFLDSMLEALPNVENLNKALCFSPKLQFNNTPGGLQKDIAASKFVPCNSKYEDCLDVEPAEAWPVKLLDPFEQSSIDEGTHQQSSLEESILLDLEMAIAQFTEKTRLCFRDALYRLARNTTQQHVVQDQDGDLNMQREMAQTDHNETVRSEDNKPMESETNSVDRAIANLMFNKMDVNVQDLPLTTSANSKKEGTRTKSPQGKASNQTQQHFYHPYSLNLQGGTEVPRFNQSEQRTASKSHIMYRDPTKKSFMLEFG